MSSEQKQQPMADKTLREDPTMDSAPPSAARTHEDYYKRFSVGDLIVKETDQFLEQLSRNEVRFGKIVEICEDQTFSVRYVGGIEQTHSSLCQLFSEWLREGKKKI
jgi:hypothetical protein